MVAALIFCAIIIMPFITRLHDEKIYSGGGGYVSVQMESFEPPEAIYIPPTAPPPPPEKVREVVSYVPPVIVDSVEEVNSLLPTSDELSDITFDETEITSYGSGGDFTGMEGGVPGDEPFSFVEIMPTFRGGDIEKFREWVIRNTNYPQEAVNRKIRGKVYLTFIVETDGSVSNVTVVQGVDPLIDVEAVKAIQASPKWTPGMQRGKPVRVRYSIPLNFLL